MACGMGIVVRWSDLLVNPVRKPPSLGRPPVQLETSVPKGGTKTPNIVHPDGHDTAFSIPAGKTFVVTDVSIQRLSVLGTAILLEVSLTQDIPPAEERQIAGASSGRRQPMSSGPSAPELLSRRRSW